MLLTIVGLAVQVYLAISSSADQPDVRYSVPDVLFNTVFLLEFLAKVVALGFNRTGRFAYWKNSWNKSDLVILIGSLACKLQLQYYQSFHCLRNHYELVTSPRQ